MSYCWLVLSTILLIRKEDAGVQKRGLKNICRHETPAKAAKTCSLSCIADLKISQTQPSLKWKKAGAAQQMCETASIVKELVSVLSVLGLTLTWFFTAVFRALDTWSNCVIFVLALSFKNCAEELGVIRNEVALVRIWLARPTCFCLSRDLYTATVALLWACFDTLHQYVCIPGRRISVHASTKRTNQTSELKNYSIDGC